MYGFSKIGSQITLKHSNAKHVQRKSMKPHARARIGAISGGLGGCLGMHCQVLSRIASFSLAFPGLPGPSWGTLGRLGVHPSRASGRLEAVGGDQSSSQPQPLQLAAMVAAALKRPAAAEAAADASDSPSPEGGSKGDALNPRALSPPNPHHIPLSPRGAG